MNMEFERISLKRTKEFSGYIQSEDNFYRFIEEFGVNGVHWSQPTTLSASYFLRLLLNGSSARARGYGHKNAMEDDEHSQQMQPFYSKLLDHGAMWRLSNGKVICTAMPYGTEEGIRNAFYRMVEEFNYPESIKLGFLEDVFQYRLNGDYMIVIYADNEETNYSSRKLFEKFQEKVTKNSSPARTRINTMNSYVRNRYVSEFAKKRANGICQLCGKPAPFETRNGEPYLEAHHIIPLANEGTDSIDNIAALCPNCHRKMHSLSLDKDIQFLLGVVSKI